MKQYNFIGGLPRSGSTLLTSILNQNPRFYSDVTDPLYEYIMSVINLHNIETLNVSQSRRAKILKGMIDGYYDNKPEVCFNTNRSWTDKAYLLKKIIPNFKMIVMVRDLQDILNSFELLHRKSPLQTKQIFDHNPFTNVNERMEYLMEEHGHIKTCIHLLNNSFIEDNKEHVIYVTYNSLVSNPEKTMRIIYDFLDEEYYNHDFNNLNYIPKQEKFLGMPGVHNVGNKVEIKKRNIVIPEEYYDSAKKFNHWRLIDKSNMNWIDI